MCAGTYFSHKNIALQKPAVTFASYRWFSSISRFDSICGQWYISPSLIEVYNFTNFCQHMRILCFLFKTNSSLTSPYGHIGYAYMYLLKGLLWTLGKGLYFVDNLISTIVIVRPC